MPNLDPVQVKVFVDDTALDKAAGKASKTGSAIKKMGEDGTKSTENLKSSLGGLTSHLESLSPVVGQAGNALEGMLGTGLSGAGLLTAGIGTAAGAVLAFADEASKKYVELAEQTEAYSRVTGESADTASRQLDAFAELGVGADVATSSMVKLDKAITTAPKHLTALGVEIAHNKDGTTDLNGTLLNIVDAYNSTSDAAKRTEIALAAFGKAGAEMIPVLAAGSDNLRKMEADAKVVFSDADIQSVHDYKIEQQELAQEQAAFAAGPGKAWLDIQKGSLEALLEVPYSWRKTDEAEQKAMETTGHHVTNLRALDGEIRRQYQDGLKAKEGLDKLAAAQKDAADAAAKHAAELDNLFNAEDASEHASIQLERDQERLEASLKLTADATHTANDVLLTQKEDLLSVAGAAQKAQEESDKLTSGAVDATAAHQAYIGKLEEEASHLAPGSQLRVWLDQYIAKLRNEIPADIATRFHVSVSSEGAFLDGTNIGLTAYASGGRPTPNVPAVIGDAGPEIWVPDRPGTIYPHGVQPPTGAPAVGGDTTINIDVAQTGASPAEIAREVAWAMKGRG